VLREIYYSDIFNTRKLTLFLDGKSGKKKP